MCRDPSRIKGVISLMTCIHLISRQAFSFDYRIEIGESALTQR